jgi:multidrug transporter EmrE-like cation transporter
MGTFIISGAGIVLFGESCNAMKLGSLTMLVLGVIGLNLSGDGH